MSVQHLTVYQAASSLGVSVHTVRRWCKDFSAHLSAGANPETGTARRISPHDMAVLSEVLRLRGDGLSTPLIHTQLNETVFPAPLTESSQAAQEGQGASITPVAVIMDALQSVVAPVVVAQQAQDARIDAQAARLQALEQRNRPTWGDVIWIAVATFIAGAIMASAWAWFR